MPACRRTISQRRIGPAPSPRLSSWIVAAMFGMIAVPAYFTLHTARVSSPGIPISPNPSPYGYTVSLLLFIIPIIVIAFWFIPREEIKISRKAFWWTIGILFPLGALLDFLFASPLLSVSQSRRDSGNQSARPRKLGAGRGIHLLLHRLHRHPAALHLARRILALRLYRAGSSRRPYRLRPAVALPSGIPVAGRRAYRGRIRSIAESSRLRCPASRSISSFLSSARFCRPASSFPARGRLSTGAPSA